MDVESRDGWTFLRLVSTNNTWQWTNRVASPSYTNTIRAVCSFSQKKITENVFSPFFYLFSPPLQIWMRWRGILWCVWRVGFFILFSLLFCPRKWEESFPIFNGSSYTYTPGLGWSLVEWVAWPGLHILDADARLCAVWCLWSAEGPLLFFPFYLLELLDGSPIVCGMGCEHVICLWSFLSLFP
jgi:hypothetical protein